MEGVPIHAASPQVTAGPSGNRGAASGKTPRGGESRFNPSRRHLAAVPRRHVPARVRAVSVDHPVVLATGRDDAAGPSLYSGVLLLAGIFGAAATLWSTKRSRQASAHRRPATLTRLGQLQQI